MILLEATGYIADIATWVESGKDLDAMLPDQSGFGTWLGEVIKDAI